MSDPMAVISVQMPTDMIDALRTLATKDERTLSAEIRIAVRDHIARANATEDVAA